MNERIKELAKQHFLRDIRTENGWEDYPHYEFNEDELEKFAELIVGECIDIASQEDFDVMMKEGYPCSQTAKKIKQHFGVEE